MSRTLSLSVAFDWPGWSVMLQSTDLEWKAGSPSMPPADPPLSPEAAGVLALLTGHQSEIAAAINAVHGTQAEARLRGYPPGPSALGRYFRVREENGVDSDGDGLTDTEELALGLNIFCGDTDGDGMDDRYEVVNNLDARSNSDDWLDPDSDGLANIEEARLGTDARKADTDEDGALDGDDAAPGDDAVDWQRSPEPSYVWVPLTGYDPATHGKPVSMNNRGDVLCQRAVWSGGTWTPLNQQGEEYAVTDGFESAPAVLDPGWVVDIDDAGRVLGGGELPDPVRGSDEGYHSILWNTPQSKPFIVGRNPGSTLFCSETTGWPMALTPDGRILTADRMAETWPQGEAWAWRAPGEAQTTATLTWPVPAGTTASLLRCGFGGGPLWTWCLIPAGGACVARLHDAANNVDSAVLLEPDGTPNGLLAEEFGPQDPKVSAFVAGAAPPAADAERKAGVVLAKVYGGNVFVGRRDATGTRAWNPSPSLQGAKAVNARGEATDGTSLWRNGQWAPVRDLIPPGDLSADRQVGVVDLNDEGLILCAERQAGASPEAEPAALGLAVPADLAIVRPGTEKEEKPVLLTAEAEDTEGGVVNVNWDDDDNSEGPGVHGKIDYKSDFQDTGPIPAGKTDDDFIQLRIGKAATAGLTARLTFDDARIALWRNANRTEKVVSGQTEFDLAAERTIYVEGLKPTAPEQPVLVAMSTHKTGDEEWSAGDSVKLHVATPVIYMLGIAPDMEDAEQNEVVGALRDLKKEAVLGRLRVDERSNTAMLKGKSAGGKTRYYSVDVFSAWPTKEQDQDYIARPVSGDKQMKMALGVDGAHVVFGGHANFGLGPSFTKGGSPTVKQFMNLSNNGVAGIVLREEDRGGVENLMLREDHGGPGFALAEGETMGTVANGEVNIGGAFHPRRFPPDEESFDLVAEAGGIPAHHFVEEISVPAELGPNGEVNVQAHTVRQYVTIVASSDDCPTLRYSSLFMGSCNSGRHFGLTLNRRPFVFTCSTVSGLMARKPYDASEPKPASPAMTYLYLERLVQGRSLSSTVAYLNQVRERGTPANSYRLAE